MLFLTNFVLMMCFYQTYAQSHHKHLIRPKEELLTGVESEPGINMNTGLRYTNEEVTTTPDPNTIISVQRVSRNRLGKRQGGSRRTDGEGSANSEGVRQRLDSIVLLLSRMNDRLVSLETQQNQWRERIDSIQYRLTKMELMDEERKSQLAQLSNNVKHRLETTDKGLERLYRITEQIKTTVQENNSQGNEINTSIQSLTMPESSGRPKIQAVLAALFGVKNDVQKLSKGINQSQDTILDIQNTTNHLGELTDTMITKTYFNKKMIDKQHNNPTQCQQPYIVPQKTSNKKSDPEDCWELLKRKGQKNSGIYRIQPQTSREPFFVYCDMETDGGGWTVIQRRQDGSVDFAREWLDYKHGFGNLAGEFWLGNEKIHHLTNHHVSQLEIQLADFDQQVGRAHYSAFAMGNEVEGYALKLLGYYDGDAGDSLLYHVGQRWSTYDSDSDAHPERNCARDHTGAWWYKACDTSNLNGRYLHGPVPMEHEYTGLYWYDFRGPLYSLWKSTMMIRRGGSVKTPIIIPFPTPTGPSTPNSRNHSEIRNDNKNTFGIHDEEGIIDEYDG